MKIKKIWIAFFCVALSLFTFGCGPSKDELKADISELKNQKESLAIQLKNAKDQIETLNELSNGYKQEASKLKQENINLQNELSNTLKKIIQVEECAKKTPPPTTKEVQGEIFITTKKGDSIKLGGTEILVFDAKVINELIKKNDPIAMMEFKKNQEEMTKCIAEMMKIYKNSDKTSLSGISTAQAEVELVEFKRKSINENNQPFETGSYLYLLLPNPKKNIASNSDGKFKLNVLPGENLIISAFVKRTLGNSVELCFWLVPLEIGTDGSVTELMLTNSNMGRKGGCLPVLPENEKLKN